MNDINELRLGLSRRFLFLYYQQHQRWLFPLPLLKYFQPLQVINTSVNFYRKIKS